MFLKADKAIACRAICKRKVRTPNERGTLEDQPSLPSGFFGQVNQGGCKSMESAAENNRQSDFSGW